MSGLLSEQKIQPNEPENIRRPKLQMILDHLVAAELVTLDDVITALAALTPAANQIVYWTSPTAAALTTLTAFARTILDDADAGTVRTTISAQAADATLTALAGVAGTAGLIEQTAPDTFAIRLIGVANATDVLTRAGGDGRYATLGSGVLSFNTRTGAVTLTSGDVTGALTYTPTSVTGLTGTQSVAAFKTGLSLVKGDVGLGSVDNTADAAKNVLTATKLLTARTLAITGDLTWTSPSFDGSGNVTAAGTLATVNATPATYGSATQSLTLVVNAKGLVTSVTAQTVTPAVGSITGFGTGVATALAVNVGSAGAFVTFNGALGTPSSGTLTNCTFPTLNQNTTGSAATLTTSRNFSISGGGITAAAVGFNGSAAVALSASVDAGHITLARMADVATGTVFYRKTAGTGAPEVQTLATLKTDLAFGTAASQNYDEGTFTPAISFGGATTGITYGTQSGRYKRIGNVVSFGIRIILTSKGSATGVNLITGLPFTAAGLPDMTIPPPNFLNMAGITRATSAKVTESGTTISMWQVNAGGTDVVQFTDANFTNTSIIIIGGTYHV